MQTQRQLDDPQAVLDFLTGTARPDDDTSGLDLMLADEQGVALAVMIPVDDVPLRPVDGERALVADGLVRAAVHFSEVAGLVLAVRRGGSPVPREDDLAWHDAFDTACREHDVANLGVYVATRHGARRVRPGDPVPAEVPEPEPAPVSGS